MTLADGNVGASLGLTFASGTCTMLGAAVVFFPKLVKLASRRVLAGALGFSSGVMIYVSLIDIFQQSVKAFTRSGLNDSQAYGFATLCFFMGVLVMKLVEIVVHRLSGDHHPNRRDVDEDIQITWNENEGHCEMKEAQDEEFVVPHCIGCSADPVGDLKKWQAIAEAEINAMNHKDSGKSGSTGTGSFVTTGSIVVNDEESADQDVLTTVLESNGNKQELQTNGSTLPQPSSISQSREAVEAEEDANIKEAKRDIVFRAPVNSQLSPTEEKKKLARMGLTTAIAIIVHNFPEGLATFVAALNDPASGAVLAFAIGTHNIPEGLCVALPIYYATGSRWKGFFWGFLSGMAEPIAGILGWLVLARTLSLEVYGALFGLVGGMMIMISMKELLPTAHRYDPEDSVVTYCAIVGMAVMALSLVLFKIA
ncbi:hypothetical protein HJC23_003868 [Cyclotella cryptica]|uniref:Zinc/iron permease n=1 Tax=Cyclotella cryptica TaxID=29204 RepID=A0ABD3NYS7_9STRA|eukprot:CCRYP_018710-RA/>CCRYP_018710-RA protein AED:0.05 eAED:0.05 QI:394/1/1/1/0.66/0.5/4/2759/423